MLKKLYSDKILLRTPITFSEAWKCPAYYTCVLQFYRCAEQASEVYLSNMHECTL